VILDRKYARNGGAAWRMTASPEGGMPGAHGGLCGLAQLSYGFGLC
jgi:hypothetical protein